MNENVESETYWPYNVKAGSLIRKEVNANKAWPKYCVQIKRYHGICLFLFTKVLFLRVCVGVYGFMCDLKKNCFDNILTMWNAKL